MSKYNKVPDQQRTKTLTIRLTETEKNQLKRLSFNQNKTVTRLILESIKTLQNHV